MVTYQAVGRSSCFCFCYALSANLKSRKTVCVQYAADVNTQHEAGNGCLRHMVFCILLTIDIGVQKKVDHCHYCDWCNIFTTEQWYELLLLYDRFGATCYKN